VHRFHLLIVALVCALAVPLSGAIAAAGDAPVVSPSLVWTRCHGDAQCARLPVPLDDTVLDSPTIELGLVRYRALDPEHRIGALLVNPGGPGASAVDYVTAVAQSMPQELQDRFDIVGFDPRGVGESAPVDCTDDLDPFFGVEWAPDNEQERAALLDEMGSFVRACERTQSTILPYLETERVARDMDRIRIALGEPKLTYLGYSYGTYLGTWYAEQFPRRVRALVLDGPVDPALDALSVQVQQAVGFERSLDAFLEDCSEQTSCAFHRDGRSEQAYDELRARIGAAPLMVDGNGETRSLNGTLFDIGVSSVLYEGRVSWPDLAKALDAAERGDGQDLLFYADLYSGRSDGGTYDDGEEAFIAIGCADGPPVGNVAGMRSIEDAAAKAAPRLGRSIVNGSLACALWPIEAPPARALHARGAPPLLVIGARHDPATPFAWAKGLASELDSGRLVSVRSARHTSFDSGNACVDDLVVRYLVDLTAPTRVAHC
jgi:pimeloyl-ACP methyl ester carboxylesterase